MKIYKRKLEPITAMATINPQLCKQSSIRVELVQSNEGPNPHVHVYSGTGKTGKTSYISLCSASYADHHSSCDRLTRKERDEFVEIMRSIWKKYYISIMVPKRDKEGKPIKDDKGNIIKDEQVVNATGYEAAVTIWCDTYGGESMFKFDEQGRPIMPDYSKLPL